MEYEDGVPVRVDTVVISTQHDAAVDLATIRRDLIENVIKPVISDDLMDENTKIFINPTGRFVIGGPQGDAGLTGRKIIVDTYGGMGRHGGGAFSGKDPLKTLWPLDWLRNAKSNWPTPSVLQSQSPFMSIPSAREL